MIDTGAQINYRPQRLRKLWRTTIGKKYAVAITGGILALYVIGHMLGNLKALQGDGDGGSAAIDSYAHWLRHVGSPVIPHEGVLWFVRAILVIALLVHITAIVQLWRRNRVARPAGHRNPRRDRGSLAARTMYASGLLILAFVVFHILHFTTGTIHPTPIRGGAVYANAADAFQKWWLVAIYVGAVLLVGLHLHHALWSAAQTGGMDNPDRNWFWRRLATTLTLAVVIGFASVPILFWTDALPGTATHLAKAR